MNWQLVGYALPELHPIDHYAVTQHGGGVWAPCLRYHNGEFYIFFPEPDSCRNLWDVPNLFLQKLPAESFTATAYIVARLRSDGEEAGIDTLCTFSYSTDGNEFKPSGEPFVAREGMWIGAKIGFFALREGFTNDAGGVDLDWVRIEKQNE
jgi:beta-xylosidase